eukprot:10957192-Karenia_brevis.AAC.1
MKTNFVSRVTCECDEEDCSQVKWVQAVDKENPRRVNMEFQVADVSKPLLAVKKIIEKGNRIFFGP